MRVNGWDARLVAAVEKHSALPFAWGVSDCCMFPLDCIVAVLGRDPWPDLHTYDSRLGAARCLALQGFENLGDAFASRFAEVRAINAGRGDVAVVESDGFLCGAVMIGPSLVGKGEAGLVYMPRERAIRCFAVS